MNIVGSQLNRAAECEALLRSLPAWFGIESSLLEYAAATQTLPTFAIEKNQRLIAFLSLRQHFATSWEIHCVAVHAEFRGQGLGRELVGHCENWLKSQGVVFLQVKTIAQSKADLNYDQTRSFYSSMGFTPLEVFPALWSPRNPCLQMVKAL